MRCAGCGEPATARNNFCPHCGTRLRHGLEEAAPAATSSQLERRQLTVMFCDLVDSTSLAEGMDPEAFGDLIQAHRTACVGPIARYEGTVARYLGDGILVFFGYPLAHEDDPHRAARAGLEIVAATKALNDRWRTITRGRLAVRVGINTGIVVVGDLRGDGMREDMAVFGQAVNVAARLQKLADPDTVVLAAETRRLLAPAMPCRSRGSARIKGIEDPIDYYEVTAVDDAHRGHRHRDEAVATLPFVDREAELAVLSRCWEAARGGHGNALLLLGEPGIGKSRFIRASKLQVARDPCLWLETGTSPFATNTEFFALVGLLRSALHTTAPRELAGDEELQQTVDTYQRSDPDMALGLAALLGLDEPGGDITTVSSPERLRRLALAAARSWLIARAAEQPVVLVIENLHWADASTLEAIDLLLAELDAHRILMIMSSRSEPALNELARVETLTLAPLRPDDAQILLRHALKEQVVPRGVADALLERAGGVPLFIEELPKALISEQQVDDHANTLRQPRVKNGAVIPATLRDSLMARLDRMGGAKIVAQIGAVLGHRFNAGLMEQVWEGRKETLHEGIDALVGASVLLAHQDPQGEQFEFKHPLIEAIAYDSLLRQDRRRFHTRAVKALQRNQHYEERPELLARHYSGAGRSLAAFEAWLKAGKAAARRSAYKEALGHMNNAERELESTTRPKDERANDAHWLDLLAARAPVLTALYGWADPSVNDDYKRLLQIAERSDSSAQKFDSWRGIYNFHLLRGDLQPAWHATVRLHEIAIELADEDLLLSWHRAIGLHDFLAAKFVEAAEHMQAAIASFDPAKLAQGTHPAVIAHAIAAWALWFAGDAQASGQASRAAIDAAEQADHPFSEAYALCLAASLAQCRDQTDRALSLSDTALDLATFNEFPYWRAWACMVKGWAMVASGERDAGLSLLQDGLAGYQATGAAQMKGYGLCLLADALARVERWRPAAETAESALAEMQRSGIVFYAPEAHLLRGESLCQMGETRAGLAALLRGFRIAYRQRSLPLLLRVSQALLRHADHAPLRALVETQTARARASVKLPHQPPNGKSR